ncbi:MAG: YcxB family protein [Firmicutes bacterium]|nr:YcxB family protein [Bacillota bacterium]
MIEVKTIKNWKKDNYISKMNMSMIRKQLILSFVTLIFVISFIVLGVLNPIGSNFGRIFPLVSGGIIGVLNVFSFSLLFFVIYSQKAINKSARYLHVDTTQHYSFYEDRFVEQTTSDVSNSNFMFLYSVLHEVKETQSHFLIYISVAEAYVIPKKDIVTGSADDLKQILTRWLGQKYKTLVKVK